MVCYVVVCDVVVSGTHGVVVVIGVMVAGVTVVVRSCFFVLLQGIALALVGSI